MEVLLTYNVGLSSVSIAKDLSGNYLYLVDDIDPEKYEAIAKFVGRALELVNPQRTAGVYDVAKAVLSYVKDYNPELVTYVVSRELKYKKLQVLLDDPYVEDISIVGPGPVWVRHKYVLEKNPSADYIETSIIIATYEELMSYMELIAERSGRVVNRKTPIMDFTLPEEDGGHRVHLVLPDVAHSSGEIVVRKKLHHGSIDLESLVKAKMIPGSVAELVKLVIKEGGSIVILGPPGSGKTTLLKAILYSAIPRHWKIAIIEETPEVDVPKGASWVKYAVPTDVWGSDRGIDQMTLAKAALRASVSRFLVIGETRGAEARVLVQAMNMGLGGLCLPGDQLVLARVDGKVDLYEIREIVEGVLSGIYNNVEVVSIGQNLLPAWKRVSAVVVKKGSSKFVRVEVEGGATHEVHEDHLVIVKSGDSDLVVKKASELSPGDLLVSLPHPPSIHRGRKFIEVEEILAEYLNSSKSLSGEGGFRDSNSASGSRLGFPAHPLATYFSSFPQRSLELGRSLGYVLGLYLGAGSILRDSSGDFRGVYFDIDSVKSSKLLHAISNIGFSSAAVKTFEVSPGSSVRVVVESSSLALLLTCTAGEGGAGGERRIPLGLVLESSEEFRAGLVEGYCDSPGLLLCSSSSTGIEIRAKSRKLAESLALILKTFGILSAVVARDSSGRSYYELHVDDAESVERLLCVLGMEPCEYLCTQVKTDDTSERNRGGLIVHKVTKVDTVEKASLLYDVEVPDSHLYAISGSLLLTHNTTFHAGSPEEAIVRLTSPPIELAPQQLSMIWLFVTLGFSEEGGLKRVVVRVDEPILRSSSLILNTVYRYGEDLDLETLLKRFSRARDLWT